jgi:phospholipase/carboxylesterase
MSSERLFHRVRVPGTNAGRRFPAVVMVHGLQGNERVMTIFERTLPPGVVLVSPRAPVQVGADSYSWYSDPDEPDSYDSGLAALESLVAELPRAYPVDPDRVVLMGFSQGAALSYALLLNQPTLIYAVAGLAGFLPERARQLAAPARLAGKQVLVVHGSQDEMVPVSLAREACRVFQDSGANVEFREHMVGHKMSAPAMRDIRHWLARQMPQGQELDT